MRRFRPCCVFAWLAAGLAAAALGAASLDPVRAVARIVDEATRLRASEGLGPLATDPQLAAAAAGLAAYMAQTERYAHDADGHQPSDRASAQGYDWCVVLENIAWVQSSEGFTADALAARLAEGWRRSPEHRRNLLDATVVDTGVGLAQSTHTGRWYAVQMFGRPRAASITFSIENPTRTALRYHTAREAFVLEPGMTRTHRLCVPQTIAFEGVAGPSSFEPHAGEHWLVQADASGALHLARGPR
jgi:hypothetical protein